MSTINDGGPAFPHSIEDTYEPSTTGLSIRDYMAAKAMQGMWANAAVLSQLPGGGLEAPTLANMAYEQADAMIKARGQQ